MPNLEAFHAAWSIPADDLRFYLALGEAVRSRIVARPWVRERLVRLASEYVSSFRVDSAALEARPIDDHRSTAAYRRHAVSVLASRLLQRACAG